MFKTVVRKSTNLGKMKAECERVHASAMLGESVTELKRVQLPCTCRKCQSQMPLEAVSPPYAFMMVVETFDWGSRVWGSNRDAAQRQQGVVTPVSAVLRHANLDSRPWPSFCHSDFHLCGVLWNLRGYDLPCICVLWNSQCVCLAVHSQLRFVSLSGSEHQNSVF